MADRDDDDINDKIPDLSIHATTLMDRIQQKMDHYSRMRDIPSVEELQASHTWALRAEEQKKRVERDSKYDAILRKKSISNKQRSEVIKRREALNKKFRSELEILQRMQSRIDSATTRRQFSAQKQFTSQIGTAIGSETYRDINRLARQPSFAARGQDYSNLDYNVMQNDLSEIINDLKEQEPDIIQAASKIDTPEGKKEFERLIGLRQNIVNRAATYKAAQNAQKRMRMDPESVSKEAQDIIQSEFKHRGVEAQRQSILGGQTGTLKEEEAKLSAKFSVLVEKSELFHKAMSQGTEDVGRLSKEVKELNKDYKDQQQLVKMMQSMGGGSGGGVMNTIMNILGGEYVTAGARVMQATGSVMMHANVTSELQQMQNRSRFAGLVNEEFDYLYKAPTDARSFRRSTMDLYSLQRSRGKEMWSDTARAQGMITAGQGLEVAGNVAKAGAGRFALGVGAPTAVAAGLSAGAIPAAGVINQAISLGKGIPQGQAALQAAESIRVLDEQMFRIKDFSVQKTMDHFRAMTLATRGLGVGDLGDWKPTKETVSGTGIWSGTGAFHEAIEVGVATSRRMTGGLSGSAPKSQLDLANQLKAMNASKREKFIKDALGGSDSSVKDVAERFMRTGEAATTLRGTAGLHRSDAEKIQAGVDFFTGEAKTVRNAGMKHFEITTPTGQTVPPPSTMRTAPSSTGGSYSTQVTSGKGNREEWMKFLMDPENMRMLARDAGISLQDLPQIITAGRESLGSEFRPGDVREAGVLSRSGYLSSPEQYLQAKGALSSVGAGNQSSERFAEILGTAIAAKMDSSKNIMALVQATSRIAENSVSRGVDTTEGAARMIGKSVQGLRDLGVSANVAPAVAQYAAQTANTFASSTELDIANIIEASEFRKFAPEATVLEQELMQKTDISTIQTLRGMRQRALKAPSAQDKKRLEAEFNSKVLDLGLGNVVSMDNFEQFAKITTNQVSRRVLGFGTGINQAATDELTQIHSSGKFKTKDGRTLDYTPESLKKYRPDLYNIQQGSGSVFGNNVSGAAVSSLLTPDGPKQGYARKVPTGLEGAGEGVISTAAEQDAKLFKSGMDELNKVVGGLQGFAETLKKTLEDKFDPDSLSNKAQEAGRKGDFPDKEFGISVGQFGSSVQVFDKSVKILAEKLGVSSPDYLKNTDGKLKK